MKQLYLTLALLLSTLVCYSFQATVNQNCSTPSDDTLCYTVAFTRTVLEGHDMSVVTDANKGVFLLTIYTNTPYTNSLEGYNVVIGAECVAQRNLTVTQIASQAPDMCEANMTGCGSSVIELFLKANSDTISGNVFYATIKMILPQANFQVEIKPTFMNGPDAVYDSIVSSKSTDFTSKTIENVATTGKSTKCTVNIPTGANGVIEAAGVDSNGAIIMVAVFATCLIIAAVALKVFTSVTAAKTISAGNTPGNQLELGGVSEAAAEETSGTYLKQHDI